MKRITASCIVTFLLCFALSLQAKVMLPAYFTDNMVLQQNTMITFSGHASADKTVILRVGWTSEIYKTRSAVDGSWSVKISTPSAGGPYNISFNDGSTLKLRNVMLGEVWLCSGQSNMEMPIAGWGKVMNYEQEIAAASYPEIRLFQVKKATSLTPRSDLESNNGGWQLCNPTSVPEFSAVAYFYARKLWKELHVPIGVIDCTWGGTPAEAWVSSGTLKKVMGFTNQVKRMENVSFNADSLRQMYNSEISAWHESLQKADSGFVDKKPVWAQPAWLDYKWQHMQLPAYWEHQGLKDFNGIVWFRRAVDIPAKWTGHELTLSLGVIDDEDITYFNGVEIARGSGYNTPRVYKIPARLVKAGRAVITVRVSDFGGEGGISGRDDALFLSYDAGNVLSLKGAWNYHAALSLDDFPSPPISPDGNSSYPTVLYNAMIHPLISFPIRGIAWYQGEANVGHAVQYRDLFKALIADWRIQWKSDLPFYFVQLANFLERKPVQPDSPWAALREAQAEALHLDNTGMAVAIDLGLADNVHFKNKQEVGRRLALQALSGTYGKNIAHSGPVYKTYQVEGNRIRIKFDNLGRDGFVVKNTVLTGFTIAGPDHLFYPATAIIEGNDVIAFAPQVSTPVALRYAWADNPACSLYGIDGLPTPPFRTDYW